MSVARDMREKKAFLNGEEIKGAAPAYYIGGAESPFGDQSKGERLAAKVGAGADFVQTQPVFDADAFAEWMGLVRDKGLTERCAIIAGITPPKSLRMAENLVKIPGMQLPDSVFERLAAAGEAGERDAGIEIAVEAIHRVREIPGVAGVHVMAILQEDAVPEIVERAGIRPAG